MAAFPTGNTTVMSIDETQIEVADGRGGTFIIPRQTLRAIIEEGGHTEIQYLIYQIAAKLAALNVALGDSEAVAQAIGDMTIAI